MSKISEVRASRESWKEKAVCRGKKLKYKRRLISKWKDRALAAEEQLKTERELRQILPAVVPESSFQVIHLHLQVRIRVFAVLIFCVGVISARAVPRILELMQICWRLPPGRIPHHSSVINWICRAGLGLLNQTVDDGQKWIAVIDTSISYAKQKLLIVLRVPLKHFEIAAAAPQLKNAQCVGLKIADIWNGETVFEALTEIFTQAGAPAVILKDGGGDIGKGVRLWCESQPGYVAVARDIGHVVANELKRVYRRNSLLDDFLKHISVIRSRLSQTDFASLRPPKLRTKGRFQGISRLAEWAVQILELTGVRGVRGRSSPDSPKTQLREALQQLILKKPFILRFARDCDITNRLMTILKNKGLNQQTFHEALKIIEELPSKKSMRQSLEKWLRRHIQIQARLGMGQIPLLVSTDIIETLMGRIKHIIERNPQPEFGRMSLAVPLLCGSLNEEKVAQAIANCSQKELEKYLQDNVNNTLRKQKRRLEEALTPSRGEEMVFAQGA